MKTADDMQNIIDVQRDPNALSVYIYSIYIYIQCFGNGMISFPLFFSSGQYHRLMRQGILGHQLGRTLHAINLSFSMGRRELDSCCLDLEPSVLITIWSSCTIREPLYNATKNFAIPLLSNTFLKSIGS